MLPDGDLFDDRRTLGLAPGAILLGGFALDMADALLAAIDAVAVAVPFRHLETPGGKRMSVAMTNAGALGWVSDRRGYRYTGDDPQTGMFWPEMPSVFVELARSAAAAAGYDEFVPDACLINRYAVGSQLTLHQDRDEASMAAPIVSVSLGLPATFLWGGLSRRDRVRRLALWHADIVVWGGPARMTFHGIDTLSSGVHPSTGSWRYNLTFRRAR